MLTIISPMFQVVTTNIHDKYTLYSFFTQSNFATSKFTIKREAFASILVDNTAHKLEKEKLDYFVAENEKVRTSIREGLLKDASHPISVYDVTHTFGFPEINLRLYGIESSHYEKTAYFLRTEGGKNAAKKLGRVLYMPVQSDPVPIFIGAIPICGVILPIKRSSQYMMYNGELEILAEQSRIPYALPNMIFYWSKNLYYRELVNPYGAAFGSSESFTFANKIVYLTAELYDSLSFSEYASFYDTNGDLGAYSIKREIYPLGHEFAYPIDAHATYLGKHEDIINSPVYNRLFKPKRNVNLFGLDGLPNGIRKKNNEFITTLK